MYKYNSKALFLINVTLIGVDKASPSFSRTGYMEIDLETREVYYKDKRIGVTAIFLWSIPEQEEKIEITRIDNLTIYGKVKETRIQHIRGYGFQKSIHIYYSYSLTGVFKGLNQLIDIETDAYYDIDTGIMLEGSFSPDPLLLIAEVKDLDAYIEIIKTNVDIGPSDALTELGTTILRILYIAFLVSPIILAIFILRKIRRKCNSRFSTNISL